MVVENIGGAGASMGSAAVARAKPDGYTLLLGGTLPHDAGFEATPESDPEEFRATLAADVALWTPVVKALGLKID